MNANALLIDACEFAQTEGRSFRQCEKTLQLNEMKLFATSRSFLNATALTHLSYNIVPSEIVDLLYHPVIKRDTLMYLNRLRIAIINDNDERQRQYKFDETSLQGKLKNNKKKVAKSTSKRLRQGTLADDGKETSAKSNLWGQPNKVFKDQLARIQELKELHPVFHDQMKRIVTESPRIETFGVKWMKQARSNDALHPLPPVNQGLSLLKNLSILRKLDIGSCVFDYVYFVENLPPFVEELSLLATRHSSYKGPKDDDNNSNANDNNQKKKHNDPNRKTFTKATGRVRPIGRPTRARNHFDDYDSSDDDEDYTGYHSESDDDSDWNSSSSDDYPRRRRHIRGGKRNSKNLPTFKNFTKAIAEKLPRLKILRMVDSNINGKANFSELTNHNSLHSIIIDNNERFHGKSGSFAPETLPPKLLHFRLSSCEMRGRLDFSKFPPSLVFLDLSQNSFKGGPARHDPVDFSTLPQSLEVLNLSDNDYLKIALPVENLPPHLRSLNIKQCKTVKPGYLMMAKLPVQSLQELMIKKAWNSTMENIPMSSLSDCPAYLQRLEMENVHFDGGESTMNWSLLPPLLQRLCFDGSMFRANGLDLGELPCVSTIEFLSLAGVERVKGTLTMSPKAVKLRYLYLHSTGFEEIKVDWEEAAFPPQLRHLNISNLASRTPSKFFDFAMLPHTLRKFEANRSSFSQSPDFSRLPQNLRYLRLRKNSLSLDFAGDNEPLKLDSLPRRLRKLDLSKNTYANCPLILQNLGPELREINLSGMTFNSAASKIDTEGASALKKWKCDGLTMSGSVEKKPAPSGRKQRRLKNRWDDEDEYDDDGLDDHSETDEDTYSSSSDESDDDDDDDTWYSDCSSENDDSECDDDDDDDNLDYREDFWGRFTADMRNSWPLRWQSNAENENGEGCHYDDTTDVNSRTSEDWTDDDSDSTVEDSDDDDDDSGWDTESGDDDDSSDF